jgi:hypothetical protein
MAIAHSLRVEILSLGTKVVVGSHHSFSTVIAQEGVLSLL